MRKGRCLKDHTLWLRLCKLNNPSTIWYVCVLSVLGRSATSGSLLSCGLQPARLLYPWDFPSVHPGMGGQNACIESYGLSRWLSGKESACQCRRRRFDLWVGKIHCRRKWQPTPVVLSRKSHGQRSLAG